MLTKCIFLFFSSLNAEPDLPGESINIKNNTNKLNIILVTILCQHNNVNVNK